MESTVLCQSLFLCLYFCVNCIVVRTTEYECMRYDVLLLLMCLVYTAVKNRIISMILW